MKPSYPLDRLVTLLAALVVVAVNSENLHPAIFVCLILIAGLIVNRIEEQEAN